METNPGKRPMPTKPAEANKRLKVLAAETVHGWVNKFGDAYGKLQHGYNFLKQVKRVSFSDLEGRSHLQRQREAERQLRMDNVWRERGKRTKSDIADAANDIDDCLTQLENGLELLIPKPENFLFGSEDAKATEDQVKQNN